MTSQNDYDDGPRPDAGGAVNISFGYGSKFDHIAYPEPHFCPEENRAFQLACCPNIWGAACDECFEKKAHLFQGYGESEEIDPKLLVE